VDDIGQRRDKSGLPEARYAFEENVTVGEQAHDDALDDVVITDDHFRDFLFYPREELLESFDLLFDCSAHLVCVGLTAWK
jgi:hypothetical protein